MSFKLDNRPRVHLYTPSELISEQTEKNLQLSCWLTTHTSLSSLISSTLLEPVDAVILPFEDSVVVDWIRERERLYRQLKRQPMASSCWCSHPDLDVQPKSLCKDELQQDSDDECAVTEANRPQTKTCYLSWHPELGIMIVLYDDTIEEGHPFILYNIEGGEIGVDVSSHSRDLQPSHIYSWLMMRLHSNSKAW